MRGASLGPSGHRPDVGDLGPGARIERPAYRTGGRWGGRSRSQRCPLPSFETTRLEAREGASAHGDGGSRNGRAVGAPGRIGTERPEQWWASASHRANRDGESRIGRAVGAPGRIGTEGPEQWWASASHRANRDGGSRNGRAVGAPERTGTERPEGWWASVSCMANRDGGSRNGGAGEPRPRIGTDLRENAAGVRPLAC